MVEELKPGFQPLSFQTTTAMPLWDRVKNQIYDYFVNGNRLLCLINKRCCAKQLSEHELGSISDDFKATVLQLYVSCRSKLDYQKKRESVVKLKEMNLDDYLENPSGFSLLKAKQAFILLTDFLEANGITYYEDKHVDPEHCAVAEMS